MKTPALLIILFILGACGYNDTKLPHSGPSDYKLGGGKSQIPADGTSQTTGPDFQSVTAALFQPFCLRCHSQSGGNRGGINLETYANVKSKLTAVRAAVSGGYMPPSSPVPPEALQALEAWINAGAPEKGTTAPNPGSGADGGNSGTPAEPVTPIEPCEDDEVENEKFVELYQGIGFDLNESEFRRRHRCEDNQNDDNN